MVEEYSIMYVSIFIYHIFFIHCLGWTLGLTSIILAIVSSATMNIGMQIPFLIRLSSGYMPRNICPRISGLQDHMVAYFYFF